MTKKVLSAAFAFMLSLCILTACTSSQTGEPATLISDSDSTNIKEDHSFLDEQIEKANSAKAVATNDAFNQLLNNPDTSTASYKGSQDITIGENEYIDKTVSVNTVGSVTLDCAVNTLVLTLADKGFTANAKADNIIISGNGIHAELKSETGNVYIEGKDAVLTVHEKTEKILVKNATAKIHNLSDENTYITLVNGVKVLLQPENTYNVNDNTISKYTPEK